MTILDTINNYKQKEVAAHQIAFPEELLKSSRLFNATGRSLKKQLLDVPVAIIAEHKRKSPSKSTINDAIELPQVINGYSSAGAAGISVLTDTKFFGGSLSDLALARSLTTTPLLRKDFIIDPYQVYESKAYGADVILLIAASLSSAEIETLSKLAKEIDLEVLVEIHSEDELEKCLIPTVDIIGVNNRNLKTFKVDIAHSLKLAKQIPSDRVKISESGISEPAIVSQLMQGGFQGFLMGEHFMKQKDPGKALQNFIDEVQ